MLEEIRARKRKRDGERIRLMRVRCRCGKEMVAQLRLLKEGARTSCGCKRAFDQLVPAPIDHRYGRLIVRAEARSRRGSTGVLHRYVRCECDCGQTIVRSLRSVLAGRARSCGCLHREWLARRRDGIVEGRTGCRAAHEQYRSRAKRRGWDFEISLDRFRELTGRNCVYCDAAPANACSDEYGPGKFTYSGIDRVDPLRGYVEGNVVPCCFPCNRAKREQPLGVFLSWILVVRPDGLGAVSEQHPSALDDLELFGPRPIDDPQVVPPRRRDPLKRTCDLNVGMRFSMLEVCAIGPVGPRGGISSVLVSCDCGSEPRLIRAQLLLGVRHKRSCGCLLESRIGRRLAPGMTARNSVIDQYRNIARNAQRAWRIDIETFNSLSQRPCHYCGQEPSNVRRDPGGVGCFVYSGMDRVDSSRGYFANNVVAACLRCNSAKSDTAPIEFRTWIGRLKCVTAAGFEERLRVMMQ